MSPLGLLCKGEVCEIVNLRHNRFTAGVKGEFGFAGRHRVCGRLGHHEKRLAEMGLSHGQVVEVIENNPAMPMLLRVQDSRIAIDRGMAMQIMVRRVGQ